jgi:hypothetical protein
MSWLSETAQPRKNAYDLRPVPTTREERLANNEAMFRFANERMAAWDEVRASEAVEHYFCECADPDCQEKIPLRKADYESVRSNSRHFATVPGHEVPDVETVIDEHDDWQTIEKNPEVTELVQKTDPRLES